MQCLKHPSTEGGANAFKPVTATISNEEEEDATAPTEVEEEKENNKSKMAGSVCLLLTTRQGMIFWFVNVLRKRSYAVFRRS